MSDCQDRFCGLGGIRCDSCEKDRRIGELERQLRKALDRAERMRHEANEWADTATSAIQWLRNIKDGISTVDVAIRNTLDGIVHCRKVHLEHLELTEKDKPK